MRLQQFVLVSLLIGSASSVEAWGRFVMQPPRDRQRAWERAFSQGRTVEFELSYDFSVPGQTHQIDLVVLVPQTIPGRQNIVTVNYSPTPSRVFDENGNRYAAFVFNNPGKKEKVKISVKAELFRYDLLTARKNRGPALTSGGQAGAEADEPGDYLKHEKYIEKDHREVRQVADGIEGETEIDIVKSIYDYVLDNMEYSILGRKDWGAVKALELGKGDCTEYSDLFVALCRAKNIPARVVSGYIVGFGPPSTKHNWVEVYLHDYGWVPFDPTAGDVKNVMTRGNAFSNLQPVYIYLSHVRNDPVLRNYNFGAYTYWGDRIKFTDSVEFKHFAPWTSLKP
jgi:transglutaminase-like putative cysteine protease